MRKRILPATAALILILSLSAAPASADTLSGGPKRPSLDLLDLLSWTSSWFTGLWAADEGDREINLDPDGNPTTSDPTPDDPEPMDDRGINLDPDG